MAERLHDGEVTIDEGVVRSLLESEMPDLAGAVLGPIPGHGTDNVLWRVGRSGAADLVVRLPRTEDAARSLVSEVAVLSRLAERPFPVAVPVVHDLGRPTEVYPFPWAVVEWLDGTDAWAASQAGRGGLVDGAVDEEDLAVALAETVAAIGSLDGIEVPERRPGRRGGPMPPLLDGLERWLDDPAWSAAAHIDVHRVRRLLDAARELAETATSTFVHGDLLPGNLLLAQGRLSAVIDWGAAAIADPAQDLAPAWSVLGPRGRLAFREAVDVDEEAWLRGRAFELEHAVGAILYYRPRGHPLAEIMARTLDRILDDADPDSDSGLDSDSDLDPGVS